MIETITIKNSQGGKRIDMLCAQIFPEISRSRWQKQGKFFCNGVEKSYKTKVKIGQIWEVHYKTKTFVTDEILPWDFPLTILEESQSWIAIEKPYGVSVHPSVTEKSQKTIVNALVHYLGTNLSENFDKIDGQRILRPGIVHRLDKTTSGVLLVAKTNQAHRFFQEHWKDFEKIYYAVVQGRPPKKGKIEGAIIRDSVHRKKMKVSLNAKAKEAVTFFERIDQNEKYSLLKILIPTGRTHQIRVHLCSIGFPILGDELYGGFVSERIYLHAHKLIFLDLDAKNKVKQIISDVPKSFMMFFN